MNISGIRPTAGFYSHNSIMTNTSRDQQTMVNSKNEIPTEENTDKDEYWRIGSRFRNSISILYMV